MIRFKCPHCQKQLQARDHLAGKKAKCTTCQKPVVIPAPPASAKTAAAKPAAPAPEEPPVDVDAIAAAALHDETTNGKQEAPAGTIDFKCEQCDHDIQVPRSEAGKRMQCPNPECRSLIKVPAPKDGQPRKLPTVAQLKQQVEKIDEAAWGTQTDKGRATREALVEAGAIPQAARQQPRSPRERIRLALWTIGIVAGIGVAGFAATRVTTRQKEKGFVTSALRWVEPGKGANADQLVKDPLVRAAVYRAIAEYKLRQADRPNSEMLDDLRRALGSVQLQPGEKSSPERDIFLGELAVLMTDLGGSEMDEIAKEKYDWKGKTLRDELMRVLEAIRAPEARTIAMRALVTRLVEKGQNELAIGLASQLSNPDKNNRRPPATSQLVVLLLLKDKDKGLDQLGMKTPDPAKDRIGLLARVGFAEYHARKANFEEAWNITFAKGPAPDRLEACVGVAEVILQQKGSAAPEAVQFVDRALEILAKEVPDPRKVSPWLLLQTIRVAARVKGNAAVTDMPRKLLPPEFQPRGYLEIALADADSSAVGLGPTSLSDVDPASPSLDLGWEALARQNARVRSHDMEVAAEDEANARFRPMVYVGSVLGRRGGAEPK